MTELFNHRRVVYADGNLADAEWLMRVLVTHGAAKVGVDLDGKEIKSLRFQWRPSGPEHAVDYSRPSRPYLLIARGNS